jgi:hypothetical protein
MALGNSSETQTFVKTFQNFFTTKAGENAPGAISRQNKLGKTVWENRYGFVEGHITDFGFNSRIDETTGKEYDNLNIHLNDGQNSYVVSFSKLSNAASCFLQVMGNIDMAKPVRFDLKYDAAADKTTLFVKQDGQALKWMYTKENPGKKPAWKQVMINGKPTYDRTDEFEFYERAIAYYKKNIKPVDATVFDDKPFDFAPTAKDPIGGSSPVSVNGKETFIDNFPTREPAVIDDQDLPF